MIGWIDKRNQKKSISSLKKEVKKVHNSEKKLRDRIELGETFLEISDSFRERLSLGCSLNSISHDAFALCKIVSDEVLSKPHYDVQLIGGLALQRGSIAEMRTGEGKTLVATLPAYLHALNGESVHVVTVNDYLAKRDCEIMRPLYEALGVSVGYVENSMSDKDRILQYQNDIVYCTASQLGFDYLRDNMAFDPEDLYHTRGHNFAIIDEVDSILIDEARTPLIISGKADGDSSIVIKVSELVDSFRMKKVKDYEDAKNNVNMKKVDVLLELKNQNVKLTESGFSRLEELMVSKGLIPSPESLYLDENLHLLIAFTNAVRAKHLFIRDVDYLLSDGKVQIIDSGTGRVQDGRRWSDGLHSAIECVEGVEINPDNVTLGTISLQNFFRMYDKLSGMSGTAHQEAEEFASTYGMGVVQIPTHRPVLRRDLEDLMFPTQEDKMRGIVNEILRVHASGRPILVGTSSVDESADLAERLSNTGVKFNVLNAKNHAIEADIIAESGRLGAITISTNMAGRGTDIILGGNLEHALKNSSDEDETLSKWKENRDSVLKAGGLHVIGTSRNESRRVDDQLIGRSGRQGDPGSSQFFLSPEDRLMKLFKGAGYISAIMSLDDSGEAGISNRMIDKAIKKSQEEITSRNTNSRKEMLKFDDVVNTQRKFIYSMRNEWFFSDNCWQPLIGLMKNQANKLLDQCFPEGTFREQWDAVTMQQELYNLFDIHVDLVEHIELNRISDEKKVIDYVSSLLIEKIKYWQRELTDAQRSSISRKMVLHSIDESWRSQIIHIDNLRDSIHLRSYAQKQPILEFGEETLSMFEDMVEIIVKSSIANATAGMKEVVSIMKVNGDNFLDPSIIKESA